MKSLLIVALLWNSSAFAFEIVKEYRSLPVSLGQKKSPDKVCGETSKTLDSSKGAGDYEIANCQSTQLKIPSMMVAHLKGLPVQVSAQYDGKENADPIKAEGGVILEDAKDSTGTRTIKGILPTKGNRKLSSKNISAFLVSANSENKITALTVTDCLNPFAKNSAKGQFESCQKGLEKIH